MESDRNGKALTAHFSDTVQARIKSDPEFRSAMALEAQILFHRGEPALARRILLIEDITEADMALTAATKVPDEYASLDDNLAGRQPEAVT